MRRRGISREFIAYALIYGKHSKDPVETEILLYRRRIRPEHRARLEKAAGLKVVINQKSGEVVTAYYPEWRGKPFRLKEGDSELRRRKERGQ